MKKLLFLCCLITIGACKNETTNQVPGTNGIPQAANRVENSQEEGGAISGLAVTQSELDKLKPNANEPDDDFIIKGVNFQENLNKTMVAKGTNVFERKKCNECHSLTGDGGAASGFDGLFSRHEPAWVLNMVRNVKVEVDRKTKKCPTRSEEGKLTFVESRDLLELIRSLGE